MATNTDKWFVGQLPVSKGFVGGTQVYPSQGEDLPPPIWSQTFTSATDAASLRAGKIFLYDDLISVYYSDFRDIPIRTAMDASLVNLTDGTYSTIYRHYSRKSTASYWENLFFQMKDGTYRNNGTDTWRFDLYEDNTYFPGLG